MRKLTDQVRYPARGLVTATQCSKLDWGLKQCGNYWLWLGLVTSFILLNLQLNSILDKLINTNQLVKVIASYPGGCVTSHFPPTTFPHSQPTIETRILRAGTLRVKSHWNLYHKELSQSVSARTLLASPRSSHLPELPLP